MADKSPFNADGVLPHERDCRHLEDVVLQGAPRPIVLRMAANTLVQCFPLDVLMAIHRGGYDKFRRIAGEIWAVHAFEESDFKEAWVIVRTALDDRFSRVGGLHG